MKERIHWSWLLAKNKPSIDRVGVSVSKQSPLQDFPQLRLEPQKRISLSRFLPFSSLSASGSWLRIGSRGMAGEREFVAWLKHEIEGAEFGALTVLEARRRADLLLLVDASTFNLWLIKNSHKFGQLQTDGYIVTVRA